MLLRCASVTSTLRPMRFMGVSVVGLLALFATFFAVIWPYLGPFLLLAAVPLWLLFIFFLARSLRP